MLDPEAVPVVRGPRLVGAAVRPLASLVFDVQERLASFDPELTPARDCLDMVGVLTDLERSTSAALAFAARRVAQTNLWEGKGHRTPAHWLAAVTGTTVGEAVRALETAEAAEKAPVTRDALRAGELSISQGNATGKAEAADPEAGALLVSHATDSDASVKEIQQEAARIVHAASGATEAERAAKIRQRRSLRIGSRGDGSSWLHLEGPSIDVARLEAQLRPVIEGVFHQARTEGRRESYDAYAYDALFELLDHADTPNDDQTDPAEGNGDPGNGPVERPRGRMKRKRKGRYWGSKVIVRADLKALDRGHVEPGERCEIAGHGPISVAEVWEMIDGEAFVAGILTDGTDIVRVQHLGRRPTVLQRTGLEWLSAGTCAVEGCNNKAVIELDHVDQWADTLLTQITELAAPCRSCHAKKTYEGYTLGPLLANGKRRLIPPRRPPARPGPGGTGGTAEAPAWDHTAPEVAARSDGRPEPEGPPAPGDPPPRPGDALGPHDPDQPGLFDTS